jgi:hypothetical protein
MSQSVTKLWENISGRLADAANQPSDLQPQYAQAIELMLSASPVSTTSSLLDAPTMKKLVQAKVSRIQLAKSLLCFCRCLSQLLLLAHETAKPHSAAAEGVTKGTK